MGVCRGTSIWGLGFVLATHSFHRQRLLRPLACKMQTGDAESAVSPYFAVF